MFATKLDFLHILEWFKNSDFQNLIMFLPSLNPHDSIIEEHIVKNQYVIDRLTSNHTAYIFMDNSITGTFPVAVNIRNISKGQIRYNKDIVEEISSFYHIPRYKLPALFVLNKMGEYKLFTISSERQLDELFVPIGIITSYQKDKWQLESKLRDLENIDINISNIQQLINRYLAEVNKIDKALYVISQDSNLLQRIQEEYLILLNYLKRKGVKENVFNKVFERVQTRNTEELINTILGLGVEEELLDCIEHLIIDLKKIPNFEGFHSQYGNVINQMERYIDLMRKKLNRINNSIESFTSHINELRNKKLTSDEEITKVKNEQNLMIMSYSKQLSEAAFIETPHSFFTKIDSNEGCFFELLDAVYSKTQNINRVLESLNQQIEEQSFDTFISCKSEDYESATELYDFLTWNGYKPFLADKTLRQVGTDNYGYLIRKVIDQCKNMFVYASNVDYLTTPYVSSEWNQFLDQINSGYIDGHLYSIIPSGAKPTDLPAGLKTRQFFHINNYKKEILHYLQNNEREESYWNMCQKELTIECFEGYLDLFPEGKHSMEAECSIYRLHQKEEQIDWEECLQKDNVDFYKLFANKHPKSPHLQECLQRIERIERQNHSITFSPFHTNSSVQEKNKNTISNRHSFLRKLTRWIFEDKDLQKGREKKNVFTSLFAPAEIAPKQHLLVQVYLHLPEETEKVKALASEADKSAERRGYEPLEVPLKKGDNVEIELNINGDSLLYNCRKSVVWQGSFVKRAFDFAVPSDINVSELSCSVNVFVNGAIAGEMIFITNIVDTPRALNTNVIAKPTKKLFISYSHKDIKEAEKIAKIQEALGTDVFFDKHRLKAGYIFSEEISRFIQTADTFVLCWSENAANSDYVEKERQEALALAYPQRKPREQAILSILPFNIEPHAVPPADMIEHYHFAEL